MHNQYVVVFRVLYYFNHFINKQNIKLRNQFGYFNL